MEIFGVLCGKKRVLLWRKTGSYVVIFGTVVVIKKLEKSRNFINVEVFRVLCGDFRESFKKKQNNKPEKFHDNTVIIKINTVIVPISST